MAKLHLYIMTQFLTIAFTKTTKEVLVCVGDDVSLTCKTNSTALEWRVSVGNVDTRVGTQYITSTSLANVTDFVTSVGVFKFSRTSLMSPLVSVLHIENITSGLNGTRVQCSSFSDSVVLNSTIINVSEYGTTTSNLLVTASRHYLYDTTENITVLLQWTLDKVYYNTVIAITSTPPLTVLKQFNINNSALLIASYNTSYNVSVVATQCGQMSANATALHYVKCHHPLVYDLSFTNVTGYREPALVGSTVTISCLVKGTLTDTNESLSYTITCMADGRWYPDLKQISCLESTLNTTSCCHNESNTSEDIDEGGTKNLIIFGGVAALLVIIIIVIALVTVTIIIIFIKNFKSKIISSDVSESHSLPDSHVHVHVSQVTDQQFSLGVYSKLQVPQKDNENSQITGRSQTQKLVYADIGPMSFQKRQKAVIDTYKLDDDRVQYVQVKPQTRKKETQTVSKDQYHPAENFLNLDSLLIQIKPEVTPNWYQFGKAIGVDDKVLDRYTPYPPEESIVEVCDNWLRNHSGKPTWREVAEALGQINCQQLAFQIENIYETGKLPKDVEDVNVTADVSKSGDELPPPIPPRLSDM